MNNGFYLYIVQCSDGSYYIGHTEDLQQRLSNHDQMDSTKLTMCGLRFLLNWYFMTNFIYVNLSNTFNYTHYFHFHYQPYPFVVFNN